MARGYLGRPDLTADRFTPDPFAGNEDARLYRTGDVVRYLPDGNIEFKGRADFQVKIRGNRIECGEVEIQLTADNAVCQAAVLAREDQPGDQRLVAYLVLDQSEREVIPRLKKSLAEVFPDYMIPTDFVVLGELPLTLSGKLDRKALPSPSPGLRHLATDYVAPRNATEEQLAEIWMNLLQVDRVGIEDSFFDLGGHSLMATQLMSRIRSECHVEVPLRTLFENPTIAGLAPEIVQLRASAMDPARLAEMLALLEEKS